MNVTPEREEAVLFSEPVSEGGVVVAVRAADLNGGESEEDNRNFLQKIADSFEKTFIRENRWKLILQGVGTTCLITVLSGLLGSVLAFLICIFRRTESGLADLISNIFVRVMQGTPMVVVLMILYYVFL
jgi:polar amino acid transport system substrate-binding protein